MASGSRVCVVGAGLSGLVALKELLEAGHAVRCYESTGAWGGTFKASPDGMTYESLKLTVSNYFMAFSSFAPPQGEERRYWTAEEYRKYLTGFVEHFDLLRHVEFNTQVRRITRVSDNLVRVLLERDGMMFEETFTALAYCAGSQRVPYRPRFKGESSFPGTIDHSAKYSNPSRYAGKRVLCLGVGETGADVIREISEVASSCILSLRRYPAVVQRFPFGRRHPNDAYSTRITHAVPRTWHSRRGAWIARKLLKDPASIEPAMRVIYEWRVRGEGHANQFLTKNEAFVEGVADGKVEVKLSLVDRFEGSEAVFEDGTRATVDAVMCSTGYSLAVDLFEGVRVEDARSLYKHIFHPRLGSNVAFIGWARPTQGGVPVCSEMQSRYFALIAASKLRLPPVRELERAIEEDRDTEEAMFFVQPHMTSLVHYTGYLDSLAALIGCQIRVGELIWRPRLLFHVLFGSNIAATYRLFGPGSRFDSARRLILSLPVAWSPAEIVRFSMWWLASRLLRLVGARLPP